MRLTDVLGKDATAELKVTELIAILRSEASAWAKNEVMLNGLKAKIPHKHILAMVGESDCVAHEPNMDVISK